VLIGHVQNQGLSQARNTAFDAARAIPVSFWTPTT
jgi:hypothetical protein